jgi:hypothetical protein
VHRLRFLANARDLGFPIKEIRKLLDLWSDRARASAEVKALAESRAADLGRKADALNAMRAALMDLARSCHGNNRPECPSRHATTSTNRMATCRFTCALASSFLLARQIGGDLALLSGRRVLPCRHSGLDLPPRHYPAGSNASSTGIPRDRGQEPHQWHSIARCFNSWMGTTGRDNSQPALLSVCIRRDAPCREVGPCTQERSRAQEQWMRQIW